MAVDPLPGRRSTAEQLGATHTADPEAAASTVADLTDGRGADVVLEAGGTAEDSGWRSPCPDEPAPWC